MNRVDEHVMNTYPDHWKDGDFILHCYFKNLEEKIKITKEFITLSTKNEAHAAANKI